MRHEEFIARYDVPVAAGCTARPQLIWSRRGEGKLRELAGIARRRARGRRLAYLDSHFPWQRSGFRYADALALLRLRPDTVFFSMYKLTDPFPAPVLPLAQFPRLAPTLGITDVYGVFLEFMAGVLGLRRHTAHAAEPTEGLDLSGVIEQMGLRAHAGLYPGGGFVATDYGFTAARELIAAADTTFSWSPAILRHLQGVTEIAPAIVDTEFYGARSHDFGERPLRLLFVADDRPRKGLTVALQACERLADAPVHLDVVGPHDPERWSGSPERVTFHGWLGRDALRALHRHCHMFLSPVTAENPGDPTGDGGITDGFPTASASEAMSSGLLLCSANPDGDHRFLEPGRDYVEAAPDPDAVESVIREVLARPTWAEALAVSGTATVQRRLGVVQGARERLTAMGFTRAPWHPSSARPSTVVYPAPNAELADIRAALDRLSGAHLRLEVELAAARDGLATARDQVVQAREDIAAARDELAAEVRGARHELVTIGQLELDGETQATAALWEARSRPEYAAPFEDPDPLVTVFVPTYTNVEGLIERSLPSILSQEHERLEVIVVGDAAPPETAEAIKRLEDPRVRYEHLSAREPYPDDPRRRWLVAGIPALNRGLELASGQWLVVNNDDDALRPDHVSRLLAVARQTRAEVVYGRLLTHSPDGTTHIDGEFPPRNHAFGWQTAIQHQALRMFRYKLSAQLFDTPGDWDRARRMLRAGVTFHMIDEIVFDYYPSTLWDP